MAQQKEIDWDAPAARPRKIKMLDALAPNCGCPRKARPDGKPCRGCACAQRLRTVLRALDSFQRDKKFCWPTREALANRAACSVSTVKRMLRLAEQLGYVETVPNCGHSSHYRINWLRVWNAVEEGVQFDPLGGSICTGRGDQIDPTGGVQIAPQNYTSLNLNESQHDEQPQSQMPKAALERGNAKARWHVHLERSQLTDVEYLIKTFAPRAAANGLIPPGGNGHLQLLAAARLALRGENAGGLFWSILHATDRKWLTPELADDARKALQRFNRERAVAKV